jgi:hypothetical protein
MRIKPSTTHWAVIALALASHAHAANFCVSDGAQLQAALSAAATNGVNDVIKLEGGLYTGTGTVAFAYNNTSDNSSVTISGGWLSLGAMFPCVSQSFGPGASVLSGQGVRPVLRASGGAGTSGAITIANLTIRDGFSPSDAGGLELGQTGNFSGAVLVDRVDIDGNVATTIGGGARISSDGGTVTLRNSLFRNNRCGTFACAGDILVSFGNPATLRGFIGNNTVTDNTCGVGALATCYGGITISGSARQAVYNNLFFDTDGTDAYLAAQNVLLFNNNLTLLDGNDPLQQGGNRNVHDPGFVDAAGGNYRLTPDSPLREAGTAGYGSGTEDFDGKPRLNDQQYDIGAFENDNVLFKDAFEPTL